MHGASVGRALGCKRVYVPRVAGAFCALGMLHTDARQDWLRVYDGDIDSLDPAALAAAFAAMETEARRTLHAEGFGNDRLLIVRALDLRYPGQQSSLQVEVPASGFDAAAVRKDFEAQHQRLFGHIQPGGRIGVGALRVAGIGQVGAVDPQGPPAATDEVKPIATRRVWIGEREGWAEARIYAGADLRPGHVVQGPLIVEEATTTVFAGPHDTLAVDTSGNFDIALEQP
jgi:N-methylhydantoinase A